jgi:TonB-dependent SusC/RagA subfamily outer membrane receptor
MNKEYKFSLTLLFLVTAFHISWGQRVAADSGAGKPAVTKQPAKLIKVVVKVLDIDEGTPLEKVFVTIGTRKSGYTNSQGLLEIDSVIAETQVVVSFAGYIDQAKRASTHMTFRLLKAERNEGDNNSINTGLYKRPIDHFAGSANVISGDRLRRLNPVSLLDAIAIADPAFQVWHTNQAGDDPNQLPELQLRGANHFPASASIATTSANGNSAAGVQVTPSDADYIAQQVRTPNQPLVLLDGVQVSLQQLLDIDIYRIEKVTILKDAAATAAYGSRAANGVLLVQTTIPAKGVINIRYSGQFQVSAPNLESYNLMEAAEKLELEKKAGMYSNNDALYQQRLKAVNSGVNTNWLEEPTHAGTGTRHSLMLDGGDDVIRYGLDFGFNKMAGAMENSFRSNMNIGGYLSARMKNFSIRNHISYNETTGQNSNYGSLQEYAMLNPYWSATDSITGGVPKILEEYTVQTPNGDSVVRFFNPAFNSTLASVNKSTYSRFSDLLQLSMAFGHGFTLNGRILLTTTSDVSDRFLPPSHTVFAKATPDQFFKRGLYAQTSRGFDAAEGGLVLNYNQHKGLHYVYASAGVNVISTQSEASGIIVQGFTSDQIANVAFGSGYANSAPTAGKINTRLISSFVNATYSYDSRYQLDATYTRDGASEFGENARYANYFTGAASWNLHNEHFFKANNLLNQLRIRGSAGNLGSRFFQEYLGNSSYDYFTNQQYILGGSNLATRGVGLGNYLVGVGNQNLQSPTVMKTNIGMDAVLVKNRMFLRVEWYKETSKNLVLPIYSPASTGFRNFSWYDNLGGIENQGFEFAASYAIINNTKKGEL